jgi:hypothetical protein
MMIDNEFPYTSCLATACDDATRLYCEQTQCSSLNTSCSTSILESYCFVSDQFLAYYKTLYNDKLSYTKVG